MQVRIHGYELTLRLADAEKIEVVPAQEYETRSESSGRSRLLSLAEKREEIGSRNLEPADQDPSVG